MIYKIETRRGWVNMPANLCGHFFPLSYSSSAKYGDEFHSRQAAKNAIERHGIDGHVEEFEEETERALTR